MGTWVQARVAFFYVLKSHWPMSGSPVVVPFYFFFQSDHLMQPSIYLSWLAQGWIKCRPPGLSFKSSEHTMLMDIKMNKMLLCLLAVRLRKFLYSLFYCPLQIPSLIHLLPLISILNHSFVFIPFGNPTLDFCLGKNAIKTPLWLVFILVFHNLDK